jgi:archaellum biogenesis ATPase FlaH
MPKKEFSEDLQKLFLEILVSNAELFVRVQNIYNSKNFSRSLREIAEFVWTYSDKYKSLPTIEQINSVFSTNLKPPTLTEIHNDWFLDEFENFNRRQELERAILKAADLIEDGDFDPVEKLIKDATQVGLVRDIGMDYFLNPRQRLLSIKENNGQVSTGWKSLDRLLFGGFSPGELEIFCGSSGSGKSLFMQNIAINWAAMGLNGIYLTLELSEGLCSMRMDSMITGICTKDLFKKIDELELKLGMFQKKAGKLQIKYMPAQSPTNAIRSYLKEYQIQSGTKPEFIMIDYLDLLMPSGAKVDVGNAWLKDKFVSEELRNIAKEFNILTVTSSQLNRSAVDEVEFDHSHISGGISKINTADNVFGIFTSRALRERGKYQLQLLKTRSSSGVGMRVDLDFNVESLRIVDSDETMSDSNNSRVQEILESTKVKSVVKPLSPTMQGIMNKTEQPNSSSLPATKGELNASKLKSMLSNIKSKSDF